MQRTDSYGTWDSDDGIAWVLTTPDAAWLSAQQAVPVEPEPADALAELARNSAAASGLAPIGSKDLMDELIAEVDPLITAITAIPGPSRTDAQKERLADLRREKNVYRSLKAMIANDIVQSRFAMMLDGGPARVRQEDVDGSE